MTIYIGVGWVWGNKKGWSSNSEPVTAGSHYPPTPRPEGLRQGFFVSAILVFWARQFFVVGRLS